MPVKATSYSKGHQILIAMIAEAVATLRIATNDATHGGGAQPMTCGSFSHTKLEPPRKGLSCPPVKSNGALHAA